MSEAESIPSKPKHESILAKKNELRRNGLPNSEFPLDTPSLAMGSLHLELTKRMNTLLLEFGIEEKDFLLVLNPGGNWDLKRWPQENFSRLIECLLGSFHPPSPKIEKDKNKQDFDGTATARFRPTTKADDGTMPMGAGLHLYWKIIYE